MRTPKDLGKIAYDAYCETRGWKSVRGEPLPSFENQSESLQESWIAAANAVRQRLVDDVAALMN